MKIHTLCKFIKKESVCYCSFSRSSDQMCRHEARVHLTQEEQAAAEESLSVYCKPVELYNILQRRAVKNVTFLICSLIRFIFCLQNWLFNVWLIYCPETHMHTPACIKNRTSFHHMLYITWPLSADAKKYTLNYGISKPSGQGHKKGLLYILLRFLTVYGFLQPLFLQRCLHYKLQAKQKKRQESQHPTHHYLYQWPSAAFIVNILSRFALIFWSQCICYKIRLSFT